MPDCYSPRCICDDRTAGLAQSAAAILCDRSLHQMSLYREIASATEAKFECAILEDTNLVIDISLQKWEICQSN